MATIRAPLEEVRAWLVQHVRVRAGFRELVAEHDPLIVSSGFRELIEPILEREGVHARVVANRVTADADGWRATFAEGPLCEVCGERCKRSAVGALGPFAYAGDGYSDRCVALAADAAVRARRPGAVARRARRRLRALRRPARRAGGASRRCRRVMPATAEGDDRRRTLPRIDRGRRVGKALAYLRRASTIAR